MSSTRRLIELAQLLAKQGPLGTRAISRELGIPSASAHRLLHDLEIEGVVERNDSGDWELSYRLMQITGLQMERLHLPRLARPFLEQVALETRETTFLAIPSGDEIVYLDKVQTDMQLQMNVELGTKRPMHCTGLGKAVLAHLSPERQKLLLSRGDLRAFTSHTITDPILLARELKTIRSQGYATDHEEIILGVHCIAVPILNHADRPVGAISIAGTTPQLENERFQALVALMLDVGKKISIRLGHISQHDATKPTDAPDY